MLKGIYIRKEKGNFLRKILKITLVYNNVHIYTVGVDRYTFLYNIFNKCMQYICTMYMAVHLGNSCCFHPVCLTI